MASGQRAGAINGDGKQQVQFAADISKQSWLPLPDAGHDKQHQPTAHSLAQQLQLPADALQLRARRAQAAAAAAKSAARRQWQVAAPLERALGGCQLGAQICFVLCFAHEARHHAAAAIDLQGVTERAEGTRQGLELACLGETGWACIASAAPRQHLDTAFVLTAAASATPVVLQLASACPSTAIVRQQDSIRLTSICEPPSSKFFTSITCAPTCTHVTKQSIALI